LPFLATKLADPTRPVLDASGYSHRVADTDVWDSHNYEQDPARFAEQVGGLRFDRSAKLDVEAVRKAQLRPAACENPEGGPGPLQG
jgi:hypothetical protein